MVKKLPIKVQCIERRERQFLGNYVLHSKTIAQTTEFFLSESLGEDVNSLLGKREILQIDDPFMNQLPNKMYMDIVMFCMLSMYHISTEFECTLVFTPDHSQTVELNTELGEEVL